MQTLKQAARQVIGLLAERLTDEKLEQLLGGRAVKSGRPRFLSEYPYEPSARWTSEKPHPQILARLDEGRERYRSLIRSFLPFADQLKGIPLKTNSPLEPSWLNGWLPAFDAIALYGIIAQVKPARYFEVGSGNSTKFAARAIQKTGLKTRIVSIDPTPRAPIDELCHRIRQPLEKADLSVFDEIEPGDVVFIDNSHRVLMNSDVTAFFLDVLPNLPKGVWIGIHDIYWPLDYPPDWASRLFSEQYLLGMLLIWSKELVVELPAFYTSVWPHAAMMQELDPLWGLLPDGVEKFGGSFWFRYP